MKESGLPREFDALPFGAVIAITSIESVAPTEMLYEHLKIGELEYLLGDWSVERFAWKRGQVRPLDKPIPAKGSLGFWKWEGAPR
jgi:hypothetical protein